MADAKPKKLKEVELLKIKLAEGKVEQFKTGYSMSKKEATILELKKNNLKLQLQLLDVELSKKLEESENIKRKFNTEDEARKEVVKKIQERLKLPDSFGYDEDTLEIILDN